MALKVTLFDHHFCFFALYLPFYGIYNYILLFPVSLVIIIIIIIIIIIMIIIIIIIVVIIMITITIICIAQIPYNVQMRFTIKLHSPKMGYNNQFNY